MSILKPTDPSSAIKMLNVDSANTNSLINHALTVASNAYEKSESLDATVNGEKLKDPSGESIYQRDDDGNIIYNNDGTPVIKRDTSGLVTIVASKASISQLEAESARIDTLESNSVTTETLNAEKARIDALEANKADITSLNAEIARIDTLETGKADIDLANVNNAWITNGVIKDASIANEKVISVSANKLTAGTIDASKITVTNLNADNITVGTINGARIGNSSIDLDKLSQEVPTKEYLDSVEQKLQEEIDGAIETFTVSEIPTLNNEPAVNWTTDDIKSAHVGDLCYVVNSSSDNDGFCYRFQYNGTAYSWALIKDNDVTKAIQDITELGGEVTQFKSDYTSKVSEIDGGIESLKSRTTTIETTYSTKDYVDTSVSSRVETSVFNTLKNTVDENSANITLLTETVTTKADSSTVTTLSNTVNEVKQTADANSSSISSLTTTVNTKADGSKVTELETKTSTIEQNLNGVTTRVTNVEKDMATEEFVTSQGYLTVTSDAITSKVSKNEVISAINQTAESVSIDASKINLNGAVTISSLDSSLQTTINNKAETSVLEAVRTTANNAAKTATSYITDINANSGIKVGAKNNANNYVQVNSDGMSIYQDINNDDVRVASLGANGIVLGIDKNAQTIVTADGIKIANADGIVGVSVDSSGITEVATKVVNVYASIRQGSSYTLTLDSSIASGTSLEFKVELDGYSEFGEWFTITVGTNKSGTFSDSVQFSYTYNATNKQITITANSSDNVVLCFYRYNVSSDLPLVQLNGVLEFNGNQQKDIKIEVGTSGNWTYEIWSSDIVKMYYTGTYSSAFNNGNYFGAYRGTSQTLTYPFTLASVTYANVDHVAPNTGFCVLSTCDTTQLKFYPYNRTNVTATQSNIKVIAEVVGRLK